MKKLVLLLLAIAFAVAVEAQEKVIIRFDDPELSTIKTFTAPDYDVAAFKPGEYLDIVVTEADYQKILSQGYAVEIVRTTAQMAAHLGDVDDINGYRTYDEAVAELQQIAADHPDICMLVDIGDSRGKEYFESGYGNYSAYQHDIWAMKLSDNVTEEEDEPSVFYFGAHHAREPISTEMSFYILNYLVDNYGSDPEVTENVNSKQIWFVPIVNPDGHEVVLNQIDLSWRKNIRDNDGNGNLTPGNWDYPDGVDPNRNYGWHWGGEGASSDPNSQTYHGPSVFSEPELQAIRDLMAAHHFVAGITYHSYSELVLWPYGYTSNAVTPDAAAISQLGIAMANAIPSIYGSGHYTPEISSQLYPAAGVTDDWAYGHHGIFCYTVELGTEFIPPANQMNQIVEDNLDASMILLNRIDQSTLTGHVTNSVTGEPVVAEVFVEGVDDTGKPRDPYTSDEAFGSYYRMLTNGNYTVTFSAFGYISQTFDDVNITSGGQTVLDVQLVQSEIISVSGTVTDSETGLPIANAEVVVLNTPIDPVYTNDQGQYDIPEIFENNYTFKVWAEGYATLLQDVTVDPQNNVVDFELTETTAISFESGVFDPNWSFGGIADWTIDNGVAWDGNYSARSGNIGDQQISSMMITLEAAENGTVSFYRKVSSEATYDFLRFYIDNTEKGSWSGEKDWEEVSYNVSAGTHTYKWVYEKDLSVSNGEDCGWVDYIIFPPASTLNAMAGNDGEICADETFQCNGDASNYTSVEWTTSGTGTFSDPAILNPVYTPGDDDIAAGTVVLTLTAFDGSGGTDSDNLTLTIDPLPGTPSAISGPDLVCGGWEESYSCEPIANATSDEWMLSPENAGTISALSDDEVTILWSDTFAGTATLKVRGMNDCGYGAFSEELTIDVMDCTSIGENESPVISIYPNPVNDLLIVDLKGFGPSGIDISIVNILGTSVHVERIDASTEKLRLKTEYWPEGIYFLRVSGQNNTVTKKIIIQH